MKTATFLATIAYGAMETTRFLRISYQTIKKINQGPARLDSQGLLIKILRK